ncbi:MAG: M48 family metalloprotease [Rubrivivax sp.]|nr:M48 family metalloprotease [Rubrivivax sp.]
MNRLRRLHCLPVDFATDTRDALSRTKPPPVAARLLAGVLAFSTALAPAAAQPEAAQPEVAQPSRLPALGESASDDLSVGAERRLGEQIMREGRRDPQYLDDPVLLDYLQQLWGPLVATARSRGDINAETDQAFAWEAFLVRDRSVNAFALPGGYVGVHLGLIGLTTTSDQLASVLAHELTHVTQRHIARSIAPQQRASMLAIASMLLGVLAASRSNNMDAANAAIMGGQGMAIQSQLNFSRDMEREADRVGYGVMTQAGFSTFGMAAMFEKLDVATRLNDNSGFPYLRSHPLTVDRISEARNRALLAGGTPPAPTLQHAVMQARARVMADDNTAAWQRFNGGSSSPLLADRVGALYGGALAAALLKDHGRAERQADEAQRLATSATPRDAKAERAITLLQAQLQLARGDAAGALVRLDALGPLAASTSTSTSTSTAASTSTSASTVTAASPSTSTSASTSALPSAASGTPRPTLLLRAQALLDRQRAAPGSVQPALRDSTEALQTWVAEHRQDATAWELLAASADALGLRLRSMRAAAEARAVVGDLTGAIDRLRAAQQLSRSATGQDFIEGSVIDARLRQINAQRRQLQLEAREARGGRSAPDDTLPN